MMAIQFARSQLLILTAVSYFYAVASQCQVLVSELSWPNVVYVPENSSVLVNCTLVGSFWTVDLAGDGVITPLQFSDIGQQLMQLNDNGVYQLPPVDQEGNPPTLRLLINDTSVNNQTKISCTSPSTGAMPQTIMFVYEPFPLILDFSDVNDSQSANISWNVANDSSLAPDGGLMYSLTVTSTNIKEQVFEAKASHHVFSAPEGAPPCEVYNFSVTATYFGATYTGAGCNVPSPVLSRMLPSLPDISRLQSSQNMSLEQQSGEVILSVYFQVASYCEDYPVTHYTLDILSDEAPNRMQFVSEQNFTVAGNLSENIIYVYRLGAVNSVGTVWSNISWKIYTTDVQSVKVAEVADSKSVSIQCNFMAGSEATGCLVVLLSDLENTTVTLTKDMDKMIIHKLPYPLFCYDQVCAYDIESDGSTGTLPVPGMMHVASHSTAEQCSPSEEATVQDGQPLWIIGLVLGVILFVVLLAAVPIMVTAYLIKRSDDQKAMLSPSFLHSSSFDGSNLTSTQNSCNPPQQGPVYAVPDKSRKTGGVERSSGDGAENGSSGERVDDRGESLDDRGGSGGDDNIIIQESETVTDVRLIEPSDKDNRCEVISIDPDAPELPPRLEEPDSPFTELPPNYGEDNRCEVISIDPDAPELPPRLEEPDSPFTEPPPNYGEVCDKHSNTSTKEVAAAAHSNDTAHDNNTQVDARTSSDSNASQKVTPIYDDVSTPKESSDVATIPKPIPIYDDVSAPKDSSNSVSTPKATSGYQDISELPEARQVLTNPYDPYEHRIEENESSSNTNSSVTPPPQPLSVYHEVRSVSTPKATSGYQDISELPEARQVLTNPYDPYGHDVTPPPQSLPVYQEVQNLTQRETSPQLTPGQTPDRRVSPELSHSPLRLQEVLSYPYHFSSRPAYPSTFQTTNSYRRPNMLGYPQTHSFVSQTPLQLPSYINVAPRTVVDVSDEYTIPEGGTLV